MNHRKQWYQSHVIGCNWCTSPIGGPFDLEWHDINNMEKDAIGILPQLEEPWYGIILSALLTQCRIKENNCINYMK